MKDKDMIKAFAELEGIELHEMHGEFYTVDSASTAIKYNPITDGSIALKAMARHEVNIERFSQFDCGIDGSGSFEIPFVVASMRLDGVLHEANTPLNRVDNEDIARAIIEVILKSYGKYE